MFCDLSEKCAGDEPEAVVDAELIFHDVIFHNTGDENVKFLFFQSRKKVMIVDMVVTKDAGCSTRRGRIWPSRRE